MNELNKSIETFLMKNNLQQTLKAFKQESSQKKTAFVPKNQHHLQHIAKYQLNLSQPESQMRLREHLQKADPKYLRKFVDRMGKNKTQSQPKQNRKNLQNIMNLKFFKKMVQRESQREEEFLKTAGERQIITNRLLDQSRIFDNEWENDNDLGYEVYQFPNSDMTKVVKEIQAKKQFLKNAVKIVAYPENYFSLWQSLRNQKSKNEFDKIGSKLPSDTLFKLKGENEDNAYPLQFKSNAFDIFNMTVIYDRQKTGFEDQQDIKIVINEVLGARYQIVSVLCHEGKFSKVIQVKDLISKNHKRFCMKIVNNKKEFFDRGLDELKMLRHIKANCSVEDNHLLGFYDFFYHKEHLMILTEILKQNLFDARRGNPDYFNLKVIQKIAKQLLTAVASLHESKIIHNEVRPENVLVKSYSNHIIKLIDFGSSAFFHHEKNLENGEDLYGKQYKAPELLLGCQSDNKVDIWGVGCTVAEIFLGEGLFESQHVGGVLAKIQGVRGPWPSWMIEKGRTVLDYFTQELIIYQQIFEEIEEGKEGQVQKTGYTRIYTPKMTNLKTRIRTQNKNFIDFLSKCLKIDPSVRLSAKEALNHPFINEEIIGIL